MYLSEVKNVTSSQQVSTPITIQTAFSDTPRRGMDLKSWAQR